MSVTTSARSSVPTAGAVGSHADSGKVQLRVAQKTTLADRVCWLVLEALDGRRLPDWTPGSHIDLTLANGLTRQYSLCGDRWDPWRYEVAVLRESTGGGGSAYVHDTLTVGDLLDVAGPRNNFHLAPAERYLFIAGGIGITPLLPMLEQADMLAVPWRLIYGGRSRTSMAFLDRLERWADRVDVLPQDEFGLLDLSEVREARPGTKVY